MTLRPLFVIGTAGFAREMAQLASHVDHERARWEFRGFIAATDDEVGKRLGLGDVVGTDAWLLGRDEPADIVLGIGRPALKERVAATYREQAPRFRFPNLIHPTAVIDASETTIGEGNAITAGCILTVGITIGDFNLLNLLTTVGHDVVLGHANVVNPSVNLSGDAIVEDRVLIGTGAQILEARRIGSDAVVGAGALVNRDVDPGTTVIGVPARPLQANR